MKLLWSCKSLYVTIFNRLLSHKIITHNGGEFWATKTNNSWKHSALTANSVRSTIILSAMGLNLIKWNISAVVERALKLLFRMQLCFRGNLIRRITKQRALWAMDITDTRVSIFVLHVSHYRFWNNKIIFCRGSSSEETSPRRSVFLPFDELMNKVRTFVRERGIMVRLTLTLILFYFLTYSY